MTTKTAKGNVTEETLYPSSAAPAKMGNPFLQPAWPKSLRADFSMPAMPDEGKGLTKKQRLIYEEGGAQLLQQHFQRVKAGYAVTAAAQIEDLANSCYVRVGTNMAIRRRASPFPELEPYFELMMDAQLRRSGQEFNQMASDHARTQNDIAAEIIEIDDDDLLPFWAKILRPANRGR
jgi:hypothetical protein